MVRESQTSRIIQIQVRVDCNGCAQKIKKALNGINGIHDLRIDFDRQRLIITGWADPEKIVKAIKKKARKNATICSNIELESPSPKPTKAKPNEHPQQAHGNSIREPSAEATPSSPTKPARHNARQHWKNNPRTEEVHRDNYINKIDSRNSYVDHSDRTYHNGSEFLLQEPFQVHPLNVTHSYNTYMPSSYVTEYECVRSSSSWHIHYNHTEHYNVEYNVNIASMFSDDNPNACSIV